MPRARSRPNNPGAIVPTSGQIAPQRDRTPEDRDQLVEALAGHERTIAPAVGRAMLRAFASQRKIRSAAPSHGAALARLRHGSDGLAAVRRALVEPCDKI